MKSFIHLSVHTDHSIKDSLVDIGGLIKAAAKSGSPSIAITDRGNMFAAVKEVSKSMASGIKPIIGCEVMIKNGDDSGPITLLAQNTEGYLNLSRLVSSTYTDVSRENDSDVPEIQIRQLQKYSEGVIALSGGTEGLAGKYLLESPERAGRVVDFLSTIFKDRFYFQLERTGHPGDNSHVRAAVQMASEKSLPVVASNKVRFLSRDDYQAHQIRVAIAEKIPVEQISALSCTPEQYLKSNKEMYELFKDIPSAITNTEVIARRCSLDLQLGENFLPEFETSAGQTENEHLREISWDGLKKNLKRLKGARRNNKIDESIYHDRLNFELDVIERMGFPGYFLIVADFIRYAKEAGIPVGPGRGSGAGSLVAYSIGVTDLDPIEHELLFERFLNPGRVSMPDFDIDFCKKGRDRVIRYVSDKYGANAVSQIITFGKMAAKMVVRDVTRAIGLPYSVGNNISSMIPNDPGIKLQEAIDISPELSYLRETNEDVARVLHFSLQLEGKIRQVGKHAGGVLIAPGNLTDFTPLYCDAKGEGLVSQFDKDDVEKAGLVKFDFLGLRTLTVVNDALEMINKKRKRMSLPPIDINNIPVDDKKTFDLLRGGETTAVFQLESSGMKKLVKALEPDNFEEIVALVALFRPGPLQAGMVDDFVDRKHGRKIVEYPHPKLEKTLKNTYGVFVYQEQIMQAAQVLAGYSLADADLLRRAMGKKKPEEMEKQRSVFVNGAISNGLNRDKAEEVFNLMEKFSGYGFNKSHSAAYGLIAYQTAWMKAHYPSEFMAASLSSEMEDTNKMAMMLDECKQMELSVISPDIQLSGLDFTVDDEDKIVMGLGSVKGLGEKALGRFLEKRDELGGVDSFLSLFADYRADKRFTEAAIASGALDGFGIDRATMSKNVANGQKVGKQIRESGKEMSIGSTASLFGDSEADMLELEEATPWSLSQQIDEEIRVMGVSFSGHPLDPYRDELSEEVPRSLLELTKDLKPGEEARVKVAGMVVDPRFYNKDRGQSAGFRLDDGSMGVKVFADYKVCGEAMGAIQEHGLVVAEGRLLYDHKNSLWKFSAEKVMNLELYRNERADYLLLRLPNASATIENTERLKNLLAESPTGFCKVRVKPEGSDKILELNSSPIKIDNKIVEQIQNIFPKSLVNVVYRGGKDERVLEDDIDPIKHKETIAKLFQQAEARLNGRAVEDPELEPSLV